MPNQNIPLADRWENASDLEKEGARLLRETGGDFSKIRNPGVKIAVEIFSGILDDFAKQYRSAKTPAERKRTHEVMIGHIKGNPHLAIFYKSFKAQQEKK